MLMLPTPTTIHRLGSGGHIARYGDALDTVGFVLSILPDGRIVDAYTVVAPTSGPMSFIGAAGAVAR